MAPHISVRDFVRTSVAPHADLIDEPTTTLVLTSSQNRFIDIRIWKTLPGSIPQVAQNAGTFIFVLNDSKHESTNTLHLQQCFPSRAWTGLSQVLPQARSGTSSTAPHFS